MGKACRVKQRTRSSGRRRQFHGNQFTDVVNLSVSEDVVVTPEIPETLNVTNVSVQSVSHSKVVEIPDTSKQTDVHGYRLIDMNLLSSVFMSVGCPSCKKSGLELTENFQQKKGLASLLLLTCTCGYSNEFYTSITLKNK